MVIGIEMFGPSRIRAHILATKKIDADTGWRSDAIPPRHGPYAVTRPCPSGWEWRSLALSSDDGKRYRLLFQVEPRRGKWKAALMFLPANKPGSPDIVLRAATGMKAARIFAAGGDLRLMDALVEHQASGAGDSPVIAVVDRRRARVSDKRFNRATNHGLLVAVVNDGSTEWVARVVGLANNSTAA